MKIRIEPPTTPRVPDMLVQLVSRNGFLVVPYDSEPTPQWGNLRARECAVNAAERVARVPDVFEEPAACPCSRFYAGDCPVARVVEGPAA